MKSTNHKRFSKKITSIIETYQLKNFEVLKCRIILKHFPFQLQGYQIKGYLILSKSKLILISGDRLHHRLRYNLHLPIILTLPLSKNRHPSAKISRYFLKSLKIKLLYGNKKNDIELFHIRCEKNIDEVFKNYDLDS